MCHRCVTADIEGGLVGSQTQWSQGFWAVVPVSRPVGGILFPGPLRGSGSVTIHLCGLPEWCHVAVAGRAAHPLCSALLRKGVAQPPGSPPTLVRSYRTVSPSPVRPGGRHRRSALCCPVPSDRSDLALASFLPCGVPTFLEPGIAPRPAVTRTAHRPPQCRAPLRSGTGRHPGAAGIAAVPWPVGPVPEGGERGLPSRTRPCQPAWPGRPTATGQAGRPLRRDRWRPLSMVRRKCSVQRSEHSGRWALPRSPRPAVPGWWR